METGRSSAKDSDQLEEVFGESTGDEELSELEQAEQYKELEYIYKKLVVTNEKPNYGPPVQRTLKSGAHARKLGIRLKTANDIPEKGQTPVSKRQRLKTADPRLGSSQEIAQSIEITPLQIERKTKVRINTVPTPGLTDNAGGQSFMLSNRQSRKSAPPVSRMSGLTPRYTRSSDTPESGISGRRSGIGCYSSLAMYSPQTQRFTIEQLAKDRTRILRKLSNIQTHRIDKGFYVTGAPCDLRDRYNIDEEHYSLLMDITNKGKRTNRNAAGMKLSRSILQHFSPQLGNSAPQDTQVSMHIEGKQVGREKRDSSIQPAEVTGGDSGAGEIAPLDKVTGGGNTITDNKAENTDEVIEVEEEFNNEAYMQREDNFQLEKIVQVDREHAEQDGRVETPADASTSPRLQLHKDLLGEEAVHPGKDDERDVTILDS